MKNRILAAYPDSEFVTKKSEKLFVADFSKRTNKERGIEISEEQPKDPNDNDLPMHYLVINNTDRHPIDYNVFDDSQFKDNIGLHLPHGECCFFPTINDGRSWFCIVEIKDCKPRNASNYREDIKEKMDSMFEIFRKKVGIPNSIYFIASMPRKKVNHDQTIFDDYVSKKNYRKAFLVASNSATIIDNHQFDPYK